MTFTISETLMNAFVVCGVNVIPPLLSYGGEADDPSGIFVGVVVLLVTEIVDPVANAQGVRRYGAAPEAVSPMSAVPDDAFTPPVTVTPETP
jgi:hypothetical protein